MSEQNIFRRLYGNVISNILSVFCKNNKIKTLTSIDTVWAMWLSSRELLRTSAHASCRECTAGAQDAAARSERRARVAKQESICVCLFFLSELCPVGVSCCEWCECCVEPPLLLSGTLWLHRAFPHPSGELMLSANQ